MIHLVCAITLIIIAFVLILLLPHIEEKAARHNAIFWIFFDILSALMNLSEYYSDRG